MARWSSSTPSSSAIHPVDAGMGLRPPGRPRAVRCASMCPCRALASDSRIGPRPPPSPPRVRRPSARSRPPPADCELRRRAARRDAVVGPRRRSSMLPHSPRRWTPAVRPACRSSRPPAPYFRRKHGDDRKADARSRRRLPSGAAPELQASTSARNYRRSRGFAGLCAIPASLHTRGLDDRRSNPPCANDGRRRPIRFCADPRGPARARGRGLSNNNSDARRRRRRRPPPFLTSKPRRCGAERRRTVSFADAAPAAADDSPLVAAPRGTGGAARRASAAGAARVEGRVAAGRRARALDRLRQKCLRCASARSRPAACSPRSRPGLGSPRRSSTAASRQRGRAPRRSPSAWRAPTRTSSAL